MAMTQSGMMGVRPIPEPAGLASFVRMVEIVAESGSNGNNLTTIVRELWGVYVKGFEQMMLGVAVIRGDVVLRDQGDAADGQG